MAQKIQRNRTQVKQRLKPRLIPIKNLQQWNEAIAQSEDRLVVILFYSSKLSGRGMLKFMQDMSAEKSLKHLSFIEVDVEQESTEAIAKEQNIVIVPTVEIWSKGSRLERLEGGDPSKVIELVDQHAQNSHPTSESVSGKDILKLSGVFLLVIGLASSIGAVVYSRRHGKQALKEKISRSPVIRQARFISAG